MALYHVRFLRNVLAEGHEFSAIQRVVPVAECDNVEDAIRIAQERFARLERVSDWRLRADFIETCVTERPPLGSKAA
jgi:hypothetical protein